MSMFFITLCFIFGLIALGLVVYTLYKTDFKMKYVQLFVKSSIKVSVITEHRVYFKHAFFYGIYYDISTDIWTIDTQEGDTNYWMSYFRNPTESYSTMLTKKDFYKALGIYRKYKNAI